MGTQTYKHIDEYICKICLLRGIKQVTFIKEMGIARQNVPKCKKKAKNLEIKCLKAGLGKQDKKTQTNPGS